MADLEPAAGLPPELEELAGSILLGPAAGRNERYAALCDAHGAHRTALLGLRAAFDRAASSLPAEPVWTGALPPPIGPYRFVRRLGEGAFGVVYLAEQETPIRRLVAIKLLHAETPAPHVVARFANERDTLARMDHHAIARIHDAGIADDGRPHFVMEYVPGEPMHRYAAARGLGLHARIRLFLAACDGVVHAHQRGVIHRDLKPQNVLVADGDGEPQPKVIDFGLAKVFAGERLADAVRTHAGAVLGTPAYMSPEQLRGDAHDVDVRADVYSLGVMLFELLTTTLPLPPGVDGCSSLAKLQLLLRESEPPAASDHAAAAKVPFARELRGELDWVLRQAMARRRDERYPSVEAFAADLRRYLAHRPVSAGPPSTIYLLKKFVRRHRAQVALSAAAVAALLGGLVTSLAAWRDADAAATAARLHLEDFWRLADVVELEELTAAEAALWPSSPARLAEHELWLRRANGLLDRSSLHAAALRELERRPERGDGDESRGAAFLRDRLQRHLHALRAFESGPVAAVTARTEFARTVQRRTVEEPAAAWRRAAANVAADARFAGTTLEPVVGLVPLGPDAESRLEEFALLQSGRVPRRDEAGRLVPSDDMAIVLVLVPGGRTVLGTQAHDPSAPRYDAERTAIEGDLEHVTMPAFWLGKYELTQAQAAALGFAARSHGYAGKQRVDGGDYTSRHPAESVPVLDAVERLAHFELRLPHIAEWEHAARAGTDGVFGAGDDAAALQGRANVADRTLGALPVQREVDATLDDGHATHAPVGSFAPNAFGLHDTLGNVAELTTAHGEDGARLFFARGGSFQLPPRECRIGAMRHVMSAQTTPEIGLRVARSMRRD